MNTYCGPFVLAYVLKISPDEAAARVRSLKLEARHQSGVRGMLSTSMEQILDATVGIKAKVVNPHCKMGTWAQVRQKWNDKGVWVLLVTGHYVIYKEGMVHDTTAKDGMPFNQHRVSKQRLRRAWYIGELT